MKNRTVWVFAALLLIGLAATAFADDSESCLACHSTLSPALVMQWEGSTHADEGVGCISCHKADPDDADAWSHMGYTVSPLVTPKDCAACHEREYVEFSRSHHAKAGEIMASLDNVLAEKAAGLPGNIADAVNGCWQCHGSIIKFVKDSDGRIVREGPYETLKIDSDTWPNSGMGRLNPDGSKGSCHACHSRHSFDAKLARSPENCGKCHMGPDHPQIEIYNESKHGIAFYANRDEMALDKKGDWVLGRDYSAAPTCATCHTSSYMGPDGKVVGNTHDVGERISWTLRPVVSTKMNMVIFEDGFKENFPDTRTLPRIGERLSTNNAVVREGELVMERTYRRVKEIVSWEQRRENMTGVCASCHSSSFVRNFYEQFDSLVNLYNDKFGSVAQQFMKDLTADGVLSPDAPFEHPVQWVFWELWHHEGRRARHGASMMGPDYTHWHGMYEVAKHFYLEFLPEVIHAAGAKSPAMGDKYQAKVDALLAQEEHTWLRGLDPAEAARLRASYREKYDQD
jgi:hydroxylamine dehydrogenase